VVDPARRVGIEVGVDDVFVVEGEQEGVAVVVLGAVDAVDFVVAGQPAVVLDEFLALGDRGGGEHSVAVDLRAAGGEFGGHEGAGCRNPRIVADCPAACGNRA
jgi:hypothetical protein